MNQCVDDLRAMAIDALWLLRSAGTEAQRQAVRKELMGRHLNVLRDVAIGLHLRLGRSIELQELMSDGTFGLAAAVAGFDPQRGLKFVSYAQRRIRGAMLDAMRDRDWIPRLERSRAERGLVRLRRQVSLDAPIVVRNRVRTAAEELRDSRGEALTQLLIEREAIRRHLDALPRRERLAVLLYFEQELTMKEIGAAMDLSESRISQVLSGAFQELRARISAEVN